MNASEQVRIAGYHGQRIKPTLKDVVLGTPAGNKAVEEALKKSCEDQVKLLKEARNEKSSKM